MKCPACGEDLSPVSIGDVSVDACVDSCGGVWFDSFELDKLDEPSEAAGVALLMTPHSSGIAVDYSRTRDCPRCDSTPMMRHFMSPKREVVVDECPACGGFWLDVGELRAIRDQFDSEEERRAAAGEYFDDLFGTQLTEMRAESERGRARAGMIARIFKFICPSYYISGDHEWGAF